MLNPLLNFERYLKSAVWSRLSLKARLSCLLAAQREQRSINSHPN